MSLFKSKKAGIPETGETGPFPFRDESLPWNKTVKQAFKSKHFDKMCRIRFISTDEKTIIYGISPAPYEFKDRFLKAVNGNEDNEFELQGKDYFIRYSNGYGFSFQSIDKETLELQTDVFFGCTYTSFENEVNGNFNEIEKTLEEKFDQPKWLKQIKEELSREENQPTAKHTKIPASKTPKKVSHGSFFDPSCAPEDNPYPEQDYDDFEDYNEDAAYIIESNQHQAPNLEEILLSEDLYDDRISCEIYAEHNFGYDMMQSIEQQVLENIFKIGEEFLFEE